MEYRSKVEEELSNLNFGEIRSNFLRKGPIENKEVHDQIVKFKKKHGGAALNTFITWIFNVICVSEIIPACLKKGLIVSLPKGSNDAIFKTNNRGITLMPTIYKIFENIVMKRENVYFR